MNKAVGYTAFIIFFLLFFLPGCATVKAPPSPSQLAARKAKSNAKLEARAFAQSIAEEKKAEKKTVKKKKKIADPVWASIRKQKVDPSKFLSLTQLIDMALRNNPQTRQAWKNTAVARAIEKQAESKLYPALTISEKITREKGISNTGVKDNDYYFGPSAQLTYLLLDFGGRSAGIEETLQKVLQADSQYNQSIQDLLLNVEKSYYSLYSAQSAEEAAQLDTENAKADYDLAQKKYEVGLVAKLDVLQAKSNYEDSLYTLEDAKGKVKSAKAELAQVIGVAADTMFDIAVPAKELPTNINEEDVTALIEEAMGKRPDIQAYRADLQSKKAALKAATSDLLPKLNLGATAGQDQYHYYGASQANSSAHDYTGYASVDWDIFDGFYNLNKRKQAKGELDIAYEALIQAELAASADVWVNYYDYNTAVRKLEFSRAFFDTAETSYDLALESYNAGLKSILDLLSAQSKLSDARSKFIQSREDVFVAIAQMAHATGSSNVSSQSLKSGQMPRGMDKND